MDIEIDETLAEAYALSGDYEQLGLLADGLLSRLEAAGADPRRHGPDPAQGGERAARGQAAAAGQLAAAADIAMRLQRRRAGGRIDAVAARHALVGGELELAADLASRSLAAAQEAGLDGWAAEVALESLDVIGRRERAREPECGTRRISSGPSRSPVSAHLACGGSRLCTSSPRSRC